MIGTRVSPTPSAAHTSETPARKRAGILSDRHGSRRDRALTEANVGGPTHRRPGRSVPLLYASLTITAASFMPFWLVDRPSLAVLGLFLCGVGVANLYPLALALTLDAARGREDRANARSQLIVGLVSAASPYLLGSLADRHGPATAFVLEPALIGVCVLLLWGGLRGRHHAARRRLSR